MLTELKEYYAEHNNDKTAPYEGLYELLAELKKQGYKRAVVSNKVQEGVTALNGQYFKEYFNVAIGETPNRKRKPEPDMVNAALKALNSTPEEAVYVGDSEVDLQTAKNSGLLPIAVTWGFRDEELLRELGAKHVAYKPADVMEILGELNK
ncbi:HAD family hydrolase [Veillonella ratti]|uniref:HAD family hydrolase n=1 Tax=Veillonella ratti TaxID=103892 RepID=UPI0025F0F4BE|nr:HAD family hydrolase [Veillonella ratti]